MDTPALLSRLLDVIENDIAPRTRSGVEAGNKLFGAAILRKQDLSLVVAETNNEIENPLWHGEMHAIKRFYEMAGHPAPKDCLFLATHEPCSLCLSGITWSGFDNFYYLFSHQDSADSFAIPYDIQILKAVYAVPDPDRAAAAPGRDLYNRTNAYFASHDMSRMIAGLDRGNKEKLTARVDDLTALYADLSAIYQRDKGRKGIPLS
ncbi:MAG: nucleoside deaminase [Devosia sp.]|jgi:tRNA(Arg) A34 adenosine deaminase TadA|uniref:nucleoside deaminase n=1 Tax=unclassified Devosia TaxID=196773 RepID=UPI00092A14FC|nr:MULTISPECIES: nucleoside deaminase [unclassified Devosia]MBL8596164.1 nucleoside deaminase [Devosia sp.]MBN9346724.1 nucleoside deaminase [Devosia sp.]OJX51937.1 MAG: tRNA-specific adenosine deaminase [Devosia sp. 66-22]